MPAKPRKRITGMSALRHRVLSEWRGVEEVEDLSAHEHLITPLLQKLMEDAALSQRHYEDELAEGWLKAVGPFLAKYSRPTGIRDGVLLVAALDSSVKHTLVTQRRKFVENLQAAFPNLGIKDVRVLLG